MKLPLSLDDMHATGIVAAWHIFSKPSELNIRHIISGLHVIPPPE